MAFIIPANVNKRDVINIPLPENNPFYTLNYIGEVMNGFCGTTGGTVYKLSCIGSFEMLYLDYSTNVDANSKYTDSKVINTRITDIVGYDVFGNVMLVPLVLMEQTLCMTPTCFKKITIVCKSCYQGKYCTYDCMVNDDHLIRCHTLDENTIEKIHALKNLVFNSQANK